MIRQDTTRFFKDSLALDSCSGRIVVEAVAIRADTTPRVDLQEGLMGISSVHWVHW